MTSENRRNNRRAFVTNRTNHFIDFHPAVGFCYFLAVIIIAMIFLNPVYLLIGLISSAVVNFLYGGLKQLKTQILFSLPLFLFIALFNPLINHSGKTLFFYLFGSPITKESFFYGICSGGMLALVFFWFGAYNRVVTTDRFLYLFSKAAPSASLLINMTQRLIPAFIRRTRAISGAQKTVLNDMSQGNVKSRFQSGLKILSVLIGISMEDGLDTADSMKARGYGAARRTSYARYPFKGRDVILLAVILICAVLCVAFYYPGMDVAFFPSFAFPAPGVKGAVSFTAFCILAVMPVFVEIFESRRLKWN